MAEGLDHFFKERDEDSSPVAFECAITTSGVNDPADQVSAQEISEDGNGFVHEDCRWSPRIEPDGAGVRLRYPERGDRALVVVSDDEEPWIVEWTPYG